MRPASLDLSTIAITAGGGSILFFLLFYLRFCGAVSVPAKPPEPKAAPSVSSDRVVKQLSASVDAYRDALAADALHAGVAASSYDEMERALTWTASDERRTLVPGDPPIEVAGVRLSAIVTKLEGSEDLLALVIENPGSSVLAYDVETEVTANASACQNRTMIPHDGTVIAAGARETRSECGWHRGMELYVTRVETAPITPLEGYYLSLTPPQALGEADRIGGGHRPKLPSGVTTCQVSMPQSVRRALEDGQTRWRDLADFYLRHPCNNFTFPDGYRAFTKDNERPLPVVGN